MLDFALALPAETENPSAIEAPFEVSVKVTSETIVFISSTLPH
jgi:hypothetical protein